jgi:predicted alpha/beta superfamily hydrolase
MKNFSKFYLLFFVLLAVASAYGQNVIKLNSERSSPLNIGETFTVDSRILNETRRINVYLPAAYTAKAETQLPVLYMPDGGLAEDFLHIAGLVQVLTGNGTMRPFILVGIENTERRRDLTGPTENTNDRKIAPRVGGSEAFRKFIRGELMPEVETRYRTTGEKAIVGESLAGLFVVETFLLEPDLFDTYLAFDPSLWWNDHRLAESAGKRLKTFSKAKKTIYITNSSEGATEITGRMANVFGKFTASGIVWSFETMPEEKHSTIYHPAALKAFRSVFKP